MNAKLDSKPTSTTASTILTTPLSDSTSLHRRRVFTLSQIRSDFRDAQTQLIVLLTQLHEEGFTGQLSFNMSSGRVCNVETVESKKV